MAVQDPGDFSVGPAPTNVNNPQVYMGSTVTSVGQDANDRRSGSTKSPTLMSVDTAVGSFNDPSLFSSTDIAYLGKTLYKAGIIGNPGDYDAIQAQWAKAVQDAAMAFTIAGRKITPMEMLAQKIALRTGTGAAGGSRSDTSTSVSIPSPQDAEAVVKNVFQQAVGRDPTAHELAKYSTLIAGIAKSSPSTSTTTTTSDGTNTHSSTSTTNRGVTTTGLGQAVLDKVQADPEYAAYQSATTYFNAMLKAIASPV